MRYTLPGRSKGRSAAATRPKAVARAALHLTRSRSPVYGPQSTAGYRLRSSGGPQTVDRRPKPLRRPVVARGALLFIVLGALRLLGARSPAFVRIRHQVDVAFLADHGLVLPHGVG